LGQPKRGPLPEYVAFLKTVRLVRTYFRRDKPSWKADPFGGPETDLRHQVIRNPAHLPPGMMGERSRSIVHPGPVVRGYMGSRIDKRIPTPSGGTRHVQKNLIATKFGHPHKEPCMAGQ